MRSPNTIEAATREQIARVLPAMIAKAINSYELFVGTMENHKESKNFHDAHRAAKVAIAHIELLIKLARWADLPDKSVHGAPERDELAHLLERAYEDVERYKSSHEDDGDGDGE